MSVIEQKFYETMIESMATICKELQEIRKDLDLVLKEEGDVDEAQKSEE